jgi:hypothetical protein
MAIIHQSILKWIIVKASLARQTSLETLRLTGGFVLSDFYKMDQSRPSCYLLTPNPQVTFSAKRTYCSLIGSSDTVQI